MSKKRKSVIEIIVHIVIVLAILVFLYFAIVPNIMGPCGGGGSKTSTIANLKALVGIYISGQTDKKPMPKSKGHRFWLSLFVGDPDSTSNGVDIKNTYASPSQAGNLLCPEDKGCLSKDEIIEDFQYSLKNQLQGWDRLKHDDSLYTSYAGPRTLRAFTDRESSGIIGCSGSRDGYGFFVDGFVVVNNNQGAEFKEYEQLAVKDPDEWTGKEDEPNWNSELLKNVINLQSSSTPRQEGRE